MANISYGVNIIPKTNNAYTLGNSDYKWSNIYTNQVNGINVADLNAVTDVQINSTSILSNGVANIPYASLDTFGVTKIASGYGLFVDTTYNTLKVSGADISTIKAGTHYYRPIVPVHQHESVFYGLAKAAGDSTQAASSNAVGTYTNNAKTAIQNMLGVAPIASPIFSGSITLGTRYSISQGINDKIGDYSLSIGYNNDAIADFSIAIGTYSLAYEPFSVAIGESVYAWGQSSFAFGKNIVAMYPLSVAIGQYSVSSDISNWATNTSYNVGDIVYSGSYTYRCKTAHTSSGDTFSKGELWEDEWGNAFVVGNGVDYNNLSNALTLHNSGRLSIKGNMYVNANADGSGGTLLAPIEVIRL